MRINVAAKNTPGPSGLLDRLLGPEPNRLASCESGQSVSSEEFGNPCSGCQSRPSRLSAPNKRAATGRPTTTRTTASQIMPATMLSNTPRSYCRPAYYEVLATGCEQYLSMT